MTADQTGLLVLNQVPKIKIPLQNCPRVEIVDSKPAAADSNIISLFPINHQVLDGLFQISPIDNDSWALRIKAHRPRIKAA